MGRKSEYVQKVTRSFAMEQSTLDGLQEAADSKQHGVTNVNELANKIFVEWLAAQKKKGGAKAK